MRVGSTDSYYRGSTDESIPYEVFAKEESIFRQ